MEDKKNIFSLVGFTFQSHFRALTDYQCESSTIHAYQQDTHQFLSNHSLAIDRKAPE